MENHVYKHHWRHGHHHHKDRTFYGLVAMIFFALIALGVVASIYYTLNSECYGSKCANNPAAGGTCLVGTVNCNDTPSDGQGGGFNLPEPIIFYDQQSRAGTYTNAPGRFQFTVPRGMEVVGMTQDDIAVAEPDSKWIFAVSYVANTKNLNLMQAFNDVFDQLRPRNGEISEYSLADMIRSDMTLSGLPAKRLTINNFGDGGSTIVVAVAQGNIYVLRGTVEQRNDEYDMTNYLSSFKFIN